MADHVSPLWQDITDWLHRNAPATAAQIRTPASDALITRVEAQVGRPLPADLRQWWRQADGVSNPALVSLIPDCFAPMPCEGALEARADCLRMTAGSPSGGDPIGVAGDDQLFDFHPLLLPIGDDTCGNFLCVDLREGPRHGCIGEWNNEDGWYNALYWENVTDMLTDIRDALVEGRPALAGHATRRRHRFGPQAHTAVAYPAVTVRSELEWTEERSPAAGQ